MNYTLSNGQIKKYYKLYYVYHIKTYIILGLIICIVSLYNFLIEKFYENKFSLESLLIIVAFIIECLFFVIRFFITRNKYLLQCGFDEELKYMSYSFLLIENEFRLINNTTKKVILFNKSLIKNVVSYKDILIIHNVIGEGLFVPKEEKIKDLLKDFIK